MKSQITFFCLLLVVAISAGAAEIELSKHIVRQESNWLNYKNKRLDEKLIVASPEVIDYLTKDNIKNGWSNRPTAAQISEDYRNDLLAAIRTLPTDIAGKINKKLTAIILVKDLGGSAYTESILSLNGDPVAGFVVLDVSVLNKTANEWVTWKERSPFKLDHDVEISAKIESVADDNRKNALQYILLHEFGHVVSIGLDSVVPWGISENNVSRLDKYTFTKLSWSIQKDKFTSLFDEKVMDRSGLRYYGPEDQRMPSSRALTLYQEIQKTNFHTLYSATNPHDDFAESFATYVHSVRMKKPWQIDLKRKQKPLLVFELCWQEIRCKEKRKVFENILERL